MGERREGKRRSRLIEKGDAHPATFENAWELIFYAASWTAPVAAKLGLLREWRRGEDFDELSAALLVTAALIEREREADARALAEQLARLF